MFLVKVKILKLTEFMNAAHRSRSIDGREGRSTVAIPLMVVRQNGGIPTAILSRPEYAAGPDIHGVGKFLTSRGFVPKTTAYNCELSMQGPNQRSCPSTAKIRQFYLFVALEVQWA